MTQVQLETPDQQVILDQRVILVLREILVQQVIPDLRETQDRLEQQVLREIDQDFFMSSPHPQAQVILVVVL